MNVTAVTRYTTVDTRDNQGDSTVCTSAARSRIPHTCTRYMYKCVFVAPPSKSTCVGCWRGMYTGLRDYSSKTPGGAGGDTHTLRDTHGAHLGAHGHHTDHTDEPHNHPPTHPHARPHDDRNRGRLNSRRPRSRPHASRGRLYILQVQKHRGSRDTHGSHTNLTTLAHHSYFDRGRLKLCTSVPARSRRRL